MKKIFIVGSVNCDLVAETPVIPQEGETVAGSGFFTARGGKGANQAVAASRLGGQVTFCGCVGKDDFGRDAVASLKKEGIDVRAVRETETAPTGTAVILVSEGNNRIIVIGGANDRLTVKDVKKALEEAEPGDIFLTQAENPVAVIGEGLRIAKEKGLYTVFNPAPASKDVLPFLPYCDLITPNETEAEILGGRDFLLERVPVVVTTLGDKGFEIATKEGAKRYPCMKITPIDTTAAGDTLCGGLVAALSRGETLEKAAIFGSKAASIACTRKGAQPSIPTLKEVERCV